MKVIGTVKEVIEQMFLEAVACKYCSLDNECPHGMACYGGEPIEPACNCSNPESLIDYESYCGENDINIEESED